jgi:hypothetical protein
MRCIREEIERLDGALGALAREETALRLRLGQVLEVLSRGGVFDLGFSSLAAYALERCDRSVRWAEAARCLARRVESLPELRRAMAVGKVSWSMGELLARVARREDEARWLELAESRTVRQLRLLVAEASDGRSEAGTESGEARAAVAEGRIASAAESAVTVPVATGMASAESSAGRDEPCTLTCTVTREEAWLFEATRTLLQQLGVHGGDAQAEALLAEGVGTLLGMLPEGAFDPDRMQGCDLAQQRWLSELERWRGEAEMRCEKNIRSHLLAGRAVVRGAGAPSGGVVAAVPFGGVIAAAAFGMASLENARCDALDAQVRALSEALARRELELSSLVLRFHRGDGWRRLGYATETQYARERLGISQSAFMARRLLGLRLEKLPGVASALGAGQLGVEAALQVVRVATASTEAAWVARARRRTIKLLREEVAAALVAVRSSGEVNCPPPLDAEMVAFEALEQAVVSGRAFQLQPVDAGRAACPGGACLADVSRLAEPASKPRSVWRTMLGSLADWLDRAFQTSADAAAKGTNAVRSRGCGSSAGRVTLRLRMSRSSYAWWRGLEAQARAWLPRGMSWLRFLCLSLWQAWQHLLGSEVAYGHIYIRDRYRCTSPVCNRRDVTPHHLRFRSAGGGEEDENLTSPCSWCHLLGVHGGRIRATGTASLIHWELGPRGAPCVVVHGRERVAA